MGFKNAGNTESENIQKLVDRALYDAIVEVECRTCSFTIQCEPEAEIAWCDNCGKVVGIKNPLIELGFI